MSTGLPADKKRRTVTYSPASQTVCHTESSESEVEASATVCLSQIERPQPDWTDAQPRDWGVEMTEPELQQGNDNDDVKQSDLSELDSELEREPCPEFLAESILTDFRTGDRRNMCCRPGVTIMWVGHEAFCQLPSQLNVNREPVTFVTGMRGAVLMIINDNRKTMHCSHCSNFDSTYVQEYPSPTICEDDDDDPCSCPCHKLLKAPDLDHGRVFF